MSLVRLLKAGKSLTDLKNSSNRYRLRSSFLLPKFGSTKNPFTAPVPVEVIQAASEGSPGVARYQKTPAELSAARLKKTAKLPEPARAEPPPVFDRPSRREWFGRFSPWVQKLNPSGLWKKRRPVAKPGTVRPGRLAVQAELSLDKIKVMRNDLNDTDVEIVPSKPPGKVKAEPADRRAAAITATLVETQPG